MGLFAEIKKTSTIANITCFLLGELCIICYICNEYITLYH